jgi:hypothetical protein
MINSSLQTFVNKVQAAGRIRFGDVKRLQRDIVPDGISSREDAELLLTLAPTVGRADRAFGDWLVATVVDFVVWGLRPTAPSMRRLPHGSLHSWWARGRRWCAASPGNSRPRRLGPEPEQPRQSVGCRGLMV